ncbi:Transcription factor bHLH93 [Capsicum annuum]|nr:Transcription factor bHLH93 [Capsicum annuum]
MKDVLLDQEIAHGIKQYNIGSNVIMKFDMTKAYDRISWQRIRQVMWHMPCAGTLKINSDGSYISENGRDEIEGLVRNSHGDLFMAFSIPVYSGSSNMAEVMAIEFGVKCTQLVHEFSPVELTDSSNNWLDTPTPTFTSQLQDFSSILDNLEVGHFACKLERTQSTESTTIAPIFNIGNSLCPEKKAKTKKANGEPSKNLMAERRRRKRLNGRLSMLRSIVPKISNMYRTSILADTIEYTKELIEKINNLQQEMELGPNQLSLMSIFKNEKPIEMFLRNSPKFNVERRNMDTIVEINCAGKSSLLLSTLAALDSSGLEPQQCVISCFNDFAMHASCSEEMDQRGLANPEEIKQALFRNAGYAGKCL